MLLLALSDQFADAAGAAARAEELAGGLTGEYERLYYGGLVAERRAKAHLERGGGGACGVYEWLIEALDYFERAEHVRPRGNDDAILRWNTCVRVLRKHPRAESRRPGSGKSRSSWNRVDRELASCQPAMRS